MNMIINSQRKVGDMNKREHFKYIKKWVESGGKVAIYECQFCHKENETQRPQKNMVSRKGYWDSVKICFECSRLNFVKVYPNGKTIAIKLN